MKDEQTPSHLLLTALILAGSRSSHDPVAQVGNCAVKALVPVGGVPMIERVIEALLAVPAVGRIVVALPAGLPLWEDAPRLAGWLESGRVERADPAGSPSRSVTALLESLDLSTPLLVTTADHALLTLAMLHAFLNVASASEADVLAALAPLSVVQHAYPATRRTRLMFKDGGYSGCNLFLLRGKGGLLVARFWQRMEAYRKKPWRMALAIGLLTVVDFLLRRRTFHEIIERLSKRIGARIEPVILQIPEAAIDVDTVEDLALAEEILRRR